MQAAAPDASVTGIEVRPGLERWARINTCFSKWFDFLLLEARGVCVEGEKRAALRLNKTDIPRTC